MSGSDLLKRYNEHKKKTQSETVSNTTNANTSVSKSSGSDLLERYKKYKEQSIGAPVAEYEDPLTEEKIAERRALYQSNADRIADLETTYKDASNISQAIYDRSNALLYGAQRGGNIRATMDEATANDTTIAELKKQLETYGDVDALKKEIEELKAANLRYQREQKVLDDYFVPRTEEFLQNAAYRDYGNPTIDDIEAYYKGTDLAPTELADKLGFYLNDYLSIHDEILARQNNAISKGEDYRTVMPAEYVGLAQEGRDGSWEYLKDNEIDIYYNLLKTEGQESAYEFLDAMQTILNKRATQAMAQQVADAGVGAQIAYNVASIPANVLGGAGSFVDDAIHMIKGEDINPYSYAHRWQNFAQAVRQDTASDINEATGGAALPFVGTTFGDVYQAIMSGVDSAVGIGLGGTTYGILMGMGAASSEAKELYEKGASMGQIAAGGILAGAAEMVFEKVSIDHFVKRGDTKSLKTFIVNTLKQGGIEASEEVLTEIANTLSDAVVMGSQSDWQGYIDKYIAEGYSESEATVKALFNDVAPNVINAGIGGLISGGAMGSLGSLGSYGNYQRQVSKHGQDIIGAGGTNTLKALATEMAGVKGATNARSIGKLASKVESNASARNVGRLSVKIEETIGADNRSDMQKALVEKGLSNSEAKRVAALLTGNEALTEEQQAELEGNEKVAEVVKDLVNNPKSTLNQRKLNLLAARLGIDTKNANINAKSTSVNGISLKNEVDVKDKISEDGKTVKISTGEAITIDKKNAIARTKIVDGERKVYYNTDHGVVEDTDINYANEDDGLLYEAFSDMNPAFANAVIKNYDGSVPVKKYIDGMREGIVLYGMHNFQEVGKDISVNSNLAELSKADQAFALKLGRAYAEDKAKKADTRIRTAIRNAAEKAKASEDASTTEATQNKPKKGSVRFENGTRAKTVAQKRAVSLAKHLSRAIGIDIVFYDAMTTRDKNGKGANGYFDSNTNSIHLDLQNAVTDSKTIAFTLSHELVHFIKKWSPAKFNTFSKFLMEQYAAHGVSTSTLLANKMAALGKTDADRAYEEMIADACERMLLDSNAVVKLMELRKADLELFEKIKLHVLEILNNIRDAFKGVDPNTEEGIALQKMEDVLGKLHEMFEDVAVDAVQNYQAGQTLDTEAVSVSEDGTIQMQMKQYQQTGRSTLLNYLTSQYGENNANDLISTIDSIYNVMAEIKEDTALSVFGNWQDTEVELNAEGHPIFTTSINNGDYVLNQDFSRVCKKRRQLDFVLNMLAEDQAFEASHLTNEDFVKINNAIKSHGFEIACALCFVDSKRFRQAEWADSFANTWNDILGSIVKDDSKLTPFNFATKNPNMSDDGIEIDSSKSVTYRKWSEGKEDVKNRRTYENFEQMFAKGKNGKWLEGNTNVRTIATLLRDHPELRHTFRGADIIASKGFDTIQRLAPEVRSILDGWGGSSVPKPSSNDASYDSSIINSKGYNKENAYAMGGVRMNSFSDFMAHMFFDYCQAFADLSAKELPSQAYTKELTYVRLFGRSGQKINMSGIAAIRDDALPTVAGKGVTKAQAEANEKIEKMVAGLDITRLLEHLNKDIYQLTETDVEQFLDMCDYVWADESINMKHATLLQTGILYDKLSETKIEECYELLKAGKVDQALKAAGEENVDREYAKHCGTIVVGVSDAHIRKLLRDPNVRMVIPYHKSGLNPIIARELKISAYNDYTDVQNTGVIRKGTKSRSNLTNEEIKKAYGLKDFAFYDWFGKTIDGKLYDGKATADKYLEWCEKGYYDENVGDYVYYTSKGDGYILASELHKKLTVEPKFKDFTGEENYYKLLEDFDCYNTITGEHSEQGAVDFLRDGLPTDYKGVLMEALKAEQKVSDDFKEHLDNKGLRDEIINIVKAHGYTPSETTEDDGVKKQVKANSNIHYQKKTSTNRTLLANALESAAKEGDERNDLRNYQTYIRLIDEEKKRAEETQGTGTLEALNEQVWSYLGEKYTRNEVMKLAKKRALAMDLNPDVIRYMMSNDELIASIGNREILRAENDTHGTYKKEVSDIQKRIKLYETELTKLESKKTIQRILKREREAEYKRAEQKGKEALAAYKEKSADKTRELMNRYQEARKRGIEGRKKTAVKNKIRRVVRDLNHLLNHGTKERNVKEGEKDVVASAISVAELLFSDDISNADIVRLGVDNPSALANEKALLKEYKSLLDSIKATDDQIAGLQTLDNPTQERYKLMDDLEAVKKKHENKISTLDKKLSDFFARERARLNEGKVSDVIGKLVNEYSALENSGDDYIKNAYSENVKKRLEALQKGLDGTLVRDMTLPQLVEVYDAYKMIEHMVRTSNNLFREGRTEDLMEIVSAVQSEIYKLYKDKGDPIASVEAKKNIINTFGWNNLKPVFAFDRLGSDTFKELYWDAVRADDDFAKLVEEAGNFISEQREKYGFADWDLTSATEFTLADGKVFKLTLEDMMSIYAYSKRDQADAHMTEGGFVFDENNTYTEKPFDGKKILENFRLTRKHARLTETYRVDDRVLLQIVGFFNKDENANKKAYVDAMQKYMTDMGQKGNEVSRTLYGIDLFTEENYIPLQSSKDYINSNKQALEKTPTQVSLKNNGTTKPTTPNADNPLVLRAFDELWLEHIDTMSKYCAYVLPIENLTRVFNNVSRIEGESPVSTQALISAVFGNGAAEYFDQYIKDLNGGNSIGGYQSPLMAMFSRFKGTAVGASLSVIVQQPLSIIRAMDMIRPDYFAPFIRGKAAKTTDADSTWEEIKKYAPIAILKEMGGYDIGSASSTKDYIGVTEYKGAKGKAKGFVNDPKYRKKTFGDAVMYGATKADELGWGIIWKAVKKEVATEQKLTPGTEEFFKAVRDRFTEVIVRTQVYDSVNSRSGIMRSKSDINKFATSFMGEPTTIINMFYNAGLQATRAIKSKDKALIKQNIGHLARTSGVLLATTVFTALAKSAIYANRDDDDDESWTERWMKNTGDSLVSDLNPLSMIPYARDLVSIYEGWDIERPDMTLFAKVITSAKRAIEDGATTDELLALAGDIANMFGIPVKNVVRDVRGIINLISDHFDNITTVDPWGAFGRGWTGEEQTKSEAMYAALIGDDKGRLKHYKSGYKTDSDYQSAIRKALRDNDPRIKRAAVARYNGNIAEYTRIAKLIIAEKHFSQDDVVAAINAEINAIKNGESQEEETPKDEVTSIYRGSDVNDAFEYGDNALAKTIIDDLIKTKVANGTEEKNARASVKASMTSYWKPLYKAAYKAGNAEEMRRIRTILKESGIYGGIDDIIDTCKAWLRDN